MAASATRAPLTPTTASQLNVKSAETGPTKKRKRAEEDRPVSNDSLFTAWAASSEQQPETCTFTPLTTIARANLPLAWLDPSHIQARVPAGYVFTTNTILLHENRNNVLVARSCPNGGLYAIDNATETTYTAWPLIRWVSDQICCDAAQGSTVLPALEQLVHDDGHGSRTTPASADTPSQVPVPRSPKQAKNRRGAMARMSILTSRDLSELKSSIDDSCLPQSLPDTPSNAQDVSASTTPVLGTIAIPQSTTLRLDGPRQVEVPASSTDEQPSHLPEIINNRTNTASNSSQPEQLGAESLLQQYFDTLYLSKASLAFWAKGPLSRARAQARKPENDFGLDALKECYLSMVLPTKKLDLKYKESISSVLKESMQKNQQPPTTPKPAKRKQARKSKLGKNCLYTGEVEVIVKWWTERDTKAGMTTSANFHEDDLKKAVIELRNRETGMQLLLILEVLYIEMLLSKATDGAVGSHNPAIKVESVEEDNAALHMKPTRSKKKRDLAGELDANAERLCIWHTVALGDIMTSPEKVGQASDSTTTQSKDVLRDFCRDVIIPFYSVKVPEQARSICRKLGGPQISPQRPRSDSGKSFVRPASSPATTAKPQTVLKRSLQRVLSEDQTVRRASPPILSRSSTISHVPKLKREVSESDGRPASRSGMQKSVSFSNREIDLIADAKAHETKKRKLDKLAIQKKDLEEAIDALKKPNRTNAARSLMDEIESRNADARIGAVHITATPRRAKQRLSSGTMAAHSQSQEPLMPVAELVPSSTLKPSHLPSTSSMPASSKKKRAVLSAIHDTPSRSLSKLCNPLAMVEATPAIHRLRPDLPTGTPLPTHSITKPGRPVLFIPIKRRGVDAQNTFLFRDAPEIPEQAGKAMDRVMGRKGIEESLSFDPNLIGDEGGRPARGTQIDTAASRRAATFHEISQTNGADVTDHTAKEKSIYERLGWDDFDNI